MALFETSRPMAAGHLFGGRLSTLFNAAFASFATWNDARATRRALVRLSDHELDDIGLTRGDIERF